jgi:GMP synthase-like glutamine amidotransferase
MPKPLLIIKNITREGPGLLEQVLNEHRIPSTIVDLSRAETLPAAEQFGAVVVLGGPDSANDDTSKMRAERELVKTVVECGIPYLGICLGLQVLVKAVGGEVYCSPVKEIGFRDPQGFPFEIIMRTQADAHDRLFTGMGENFRVFQLHGETVRLTPKMEQLAVGRLVKNQIVKIGSCAYGMQCHLELTEAMFHQWLNEDPDLLQLDRNMLQLEFSTLQENYTAVGRRLFENFLAIAQLI